MEEINIHLRTKDKQLKNAVDMLRDKLNEEVSELNALVNRVNEVINRVNEIKTPCEEVRVFRNGDLTATAGQWTKLPLNAKAYDPNNRFDLTNSRYVVPSAGIYLIAGQIMFQRSTGGDIAGAIGIFKNGAPAATSGDLRSASITYKTCHISSMLSLTAGDSIELFYLIDAADTIVGAHFTTNMSIIKLK